jgi:arginyl-tRNA synthetase
MIDRIQSTVAEAFQECFQERDCKIHVTPATQERFGHYQCNSALSYGAHASMAPRAVAEQLKASLEKNALFERVEVAGPGFINFFLKKTVIVSTIEELHQEINDKKRGTYHPPSRERIVIDFSSPNIAKEMHVGHLRSTIIGDSLARIFEWMGHDVLRLNHVGDWGTSFGMLMAYIMEEAISVSEENEVAQLSLWYRLAKERFDKNPAFKKRAQETVLALQKGEPDILAIWEKMHRISERAFQEIYSLLDVTLETRGESFYNDLLPEVLEEAEETGMLQKDQGAHCLFFEGIDVPFMLKKSDGGYNYDTTDLAAFKHRVQSEKADRIVIVVDLGQSQHFSLLGKAATLLGYWDPTRLRFDYVSFGLVLGADNKKFKTRSGESEKLVDVLYAGIERAYQILLERKVCATEEEAKKYAQVLGINAIKYSDLSVNRNSDYVFSYDKMLRFEGNTAAFLMYSLVRIKSILRRVGKEGHIKDLVLEHPSEIALGLHCARFKDTLAEVLDDLYPHRLAEYLFHLAGYFNAFFRDCPVEKGGEAQKARLALCGVCECIFETGFSLLGLNVLEKM